MIVECSSCPVRGLRCDDCVVTALDGLAGMPLDAAEQHAVAAFVAAGLVDRHEAARLRAVGEPAAALRRTGARSRAVG
ncbi:MAG TPA: hypothetical protein P5181_03370 [Dermatophilaceae bacterium]|nr:hypothetical protein [Dermatophilaceae bacterium]